MKVALLATVLLSISKCVMGKFEGFIVGGTKVRSILDYPHVAFLRATESGTFENYICGASILNQWILVTAAHCLDGIVKASVAVGSVDIYLGISYPIHTYVIHEKWHSRTVTNDVGLMKVQKPIRFGSSVKRAILMKQPPRAQVAVITGWGAIEEFSYTNSEWLKKTDQKVWDYKSCRSVIKEGLPKGTICGGQVKSTSFASKGDSGSGLMVNKKIIIGLVSFKNTLVSDSLVVYTDVTYFYDWIVREAQKMARLC